jgi:hypothetical protein
LFHCFYTAHALGFKHGGLISQQIELSNCKKRALELRSIYTTALRKDVTALDIEDHKQALTRALMEYEVMHRRLTSVCLHVSIMMVDAFGRDVLDT